MAVDIYDGARANAVQKLNERMATDPKNASYYAGLTREPFSGRPVLVEAHKIGKGKIVTRVTKKGIPQATIDRLQREGDVV